MGSRRPIESCQLKGNFISRTLDSGFRRNDEQGSYRHIGESRYPEWPLFLLQDSIEEGAAATQKDKIDTDACFEVGKKLYEKYKKDVDHLLDKYGEFTKESLPGFSGKQILEQRETSPSLDYKMVGRLSRTMRVLASFFCKSGRYDASLKILLLTYRFGQILTHGDGRPPSLMCILVGAAAKNISMPPIAWEIVRKGNFSPAVLNAVAKTCDTMGKDEITFAQLAEPELRGIENSLREHILNPGSKVETSENASPSIPQVFDQPFSASERKEMGEKVLKRIITTDDKVLEILRTNLKDYSQLKKAMDDYLNPIFNAMGEFSFALLPKDETLALVILNTTMPNLTQAYGLNLKSDYHLSGFRHLVLLLAAQKGNKKLPSNP